MSKSVPEKFFNMLPLPILVVEHSDETLNHNLVFINNSFKDVIGWSLEDIPDKACWWQKAYPDPRYQNVIEKQWELMMSSIDIKKDNFVLMTVNIQTKHNGVKRFKVYTELKSALLEGYYVVAFEQLNY